MGSKAKKRFYRIGRVAILGSFLLTACAALMTKVEEPQYKVIATKNEMELRNYSPMIVAEIVVTSPKEDAMSNGFQPLADYLRGENEEQKKIPMTAPITRQGAAPGAWKVRFFMPAEYRLRTLPKATNEEIRMRALPNTKVAAVRFSGLILDRTVDEKTAQLKDFIHSRGLVEQENPILARYDPPWTLPFLRRNEILIPVR